MATAPVERSDASVRDAFLLYNSQQPRIDVIEAQLRERGISTWYSPRDLGPGDDWERRETEALERARVAVVIIGDQGWGPNHRRWTELAVSQGKKVLPVVIGDVRPGDLAGMHGTFERLQRLHLRGVEDTEGIARLAEAVARLARGDAAAHPIATSAAANDQRALPRARDVQRICDALRSDAADDREEALDQLFAQLERYDYSALEPLLADAIQRVHERPAERAVLKSALVASVASRELRTGEDSSIDIYSAIDIPSEHEVSVRFAMLLAFARFAFPPISIEHKHWGTYWRVGESGPDVTLLVGEIRKRALGEKDNMLREHLRRGGPRERQIALRIIRVLPDRQLLEMAFDRLRNPDEMLVSTALDEARLVLLAVTEPRSVELFGEAPLHDPSLLALIATACGGASRLLLSRVAARLRGEHQASVAEKLAEWQHYGAGQTGLTETGLGAKRLLELLEEHSRSYIAGYATEVRDVSDDLELNSDRLRIALDVKTLCAVMLSKDVEPPLSIGLFGNWGTGKTFFMDCMQAETKRLGKVARATDKPSQFHTRVAQVRFNAWHYIDANLWASLVSHIIEKLAEEIRPKADAAAARKDLVNQMETAQELKREAEDEKARATAARTEIEKQLRQLAGERAQRQVKLSDLRADDLWKLISADAKVKEGLDSAAEALGIPTAVSSLQELELVAREAHSVAGRFQALLLNVPKHITRTALIGTMLLWLIGVPCVAWLLDRLLDQPWIAGISALMAQLAAVATAGAAVIRKALPHANAAIDKLDETRKQALSLLETKRQQRTLDEINLEKQITELAAKEASTTQQLTAAEARIRELDAKLREIDDGRSLSKYLLERFAAEDYRRHLGLVSIIRRDFEKLAELLENAAKNANTEPIQRIVLYVDDLDRCPAERVMEVLQAVHLLLAFKLFVVVVGVDPRWLLHSLERSYSAFRSANGRRSRKWQTTPQNYLEKIFQIPFSLRPMEEDGFATLMRALLPETKAAPAPAPKHRHTSPPASPSHDTGSAPRQVVESSTAPVSVPEPVAPEVTASPSSSLVAPQRASAPPRPPPQLNYAALHIQEWEREYAERLHLFVPSPRAAKRFANVYRLLKARLDRHALKEFEGPDADAPGDFRAAMLLLAIASGFPEIASTVFDTMVKSVESDRPDAWFAALPLPAAEAARLKASLATLAGDLPSSMQPFINWVPRVRRFTFETALASVSS